MKKIFCTLAVVTMCAGLALVPVAQAADLTWDGDTSTAFTDGNNWVGGTAPANSTSTDKAVFGPTLTSYQPALDANRSISGLIFQKLDGGWILGGSGQTLTIGVGGITNLATSGTTTITPNLSLIGSQTWYNNGGNLTVNGTVSINNATILTTVGSGISTIASLNADTTARTFTKSGAGTLAITGAAGANLQGMNTFSAGTLILGNKSALGTGLLKLGTSTAETTIKASTDLSGVNAIANNVEWTGQLAGGTNVFSGSQNITLSGNMNGPASGNAVNLKNSLDSDKKLLFTGTFTMGGSAATPNSVTYTLSGTGNTEFSGDMNNNLANGAAGSLTIASTGITTLSGSNIYSGATKINSGVLRLSSANALSVNSALTISGVLGLGYGDFTRTLAASPAAGQALLNGNGGFAAYGADRKVNFGGAGATQTWNSVGFMSGSGAFVLGDVSADKTVTLVNPINFSTATSIKTVQVNNASAVIDGVLEGGLSGAANWVKTGTGTLKLTGVSATTGRTTVDSGNLIIANNAAGGLGYTVNAATLEVDGDASTLVRSPTLALADSNANVTIRLGTLAATNVSFVSGAKLDIYDGGYLALANSANGNTAWTLASLTNIANSTFLAYGTANVNTYEFSAGTGTLSGYTLVTAPPAPENPVFIYLAQTNAIVPGADQSLSLVVSNAGVFASNVVVSLSAVHPSFSIVSTNSSVSEIAVGGTVTNVFTVRAVSNATAQVYTNAFQLNISGYGEIGLTNNTFKVAARVPSTAFTLLDKTGFAADNGASDTAVLTLSNAAPFALSYGLSGSTASGGSWLSPINGTFNLAAGSVTNLTIKADATVAPPGSGAYSGSLSVSYLNNGSQPNPVVFPLTFNVGAYIKPLTNNVVITESSGVNNVPGKYEPGEILSITVTSTNQGAVAVSSVTNSLTTASGWSVSPSNAVYSLMPLSSATSTTYSVTIPLTAQEGDETIYLKNEANGVVWPSSFKLNVYNRAVPRLSTNALTLSVAAGQTATGQITVSNAGNASLDFTITDNSAWGSVLGVNTSATTSTQVKAGTALPLVGPSPAQASYAGESDTINIGFAFPFYGTTYSNLYVDSNGAILLSNSNRVNNTAWADGTSGDLPRGPRPLIAPFRDVTLQISDASPVRYILTNSPTRLIIIHSNVTLANGFTGVPNGTNLQFQTELFADGRIKFSYYNINGSFLDAVAVGLQGSASSYTNFNFVPASGKAVLVTPVQDRWVTYSPTNGTVSALGSTVVTFAANGAAQTVGISNNFTATFSWSSGGASNLAVSASVVAAVPLLVTSSNVLFYGNAGDVASTTMVLSNAGNAALNFTITDTHTDAAVYQGVVSISTNWTDISTNTPLALIAPYDNPYITSSNEGFSALQPIGFAFPFYGGVYTQFSAGVNGGISLGTTNRISAGNNFATSRTDVPQQFIAPYWGNLLLDSNASIRFCSTTNELVVTWQNVEQQGIVPGSDLTFQAVLYASGRIEFRYQRINGSSWPLTKGGLRSGSSKTSSGLLILPGDGTVTTNEYGYSNTNYINAISNRMVSITSSNYPVITYVPSEGNIPSGGASTVTLSGNASGLTPGSPFNNITNTANLHITYEVTNDMVGVTFVVTNSVQNTMISPLASALDEDGDGSTYDEEMIAGTDPLDSSSVLVVKTDVGRDLSWFAAPGRTYTIRFTLNLKDSFQPLDGAVGLTTNRFVDAAHSGVPVIYYKVTID